jgi:hypothetical protein
MVSLAGSALVAGTRMAGMAVLIGGLVVALIPLIGSLGAATVGFGALSVSMAGSLIPVLGVLIASFVKLSEIIKATEQHEQTAAQRRQQAAVSAQQEAAARRQLADAYRNLHDQTVAADQARQDAAQAVQEDMAAVRNAELSAEQSHINLLRAQQDLKDFRKQNGLAQQDVSKLFQRFQDVDFNVSRKQLGAMIKDVTGRNLGADQQIQLMQLLLNVKTARQGEKDAANSLHDSQVKLNRDRATEAKFLSQGLKAYPAYAQAVRQVADAKRAEASASQAAKAQAATSDQAYQKLTKQQRQIGENLDDLGKKAKRFFDPIILRVLRGMVDGLDSMSRLLRNPAIRRGFEEIGSALGSVFRTIGRTLSSKEMQGVFATLLRGGAQLTRIFGNRIFRDFLVIMGRIAVAALPDLIKGMHLLAGQFGVWRDHTSNAKKLRDRIHDLVGQFVSWLHFLGAVWNLLRDILGLSAPQGQSALESITGFINRMDDWVKKNPDKVRDFFHKLYTVLGELAPILGQVVLGLLILAEQVLPIVNTGLQLFNATLGPVINWVLGLINNTPALHAIAGGFVAIALGVAGIGKAWKILQIGTMLSGLKRLKGSLLDALTVPAGQATRRQRLVQMILGPIASLPGRARGAMRRFRDWIVGRSAEAGAAAGAAEARGQAGPGWIRRLIARAGAVWGRFKRWLTRSSLVAGEEAGVATGEGMTGTKGLRSGRVARLFGIAGAFLGKALGLAIGIAMAPQIVGMINDILHSLGIHNKSLDEEVNRAKKEGTVRYILGALGIGSGTDTTESRHQDELQSRQTGRRRRHIRRRHGGRSTGGGRGYHNAQGEPTDASGNVDHGRVVSYSKERTWGGENGWFIAVHYRDGFSDVIQYGSRAQRDAAYEALNLGRGGRVPTGRNMRRISASPVSPARAFSTTAATSPGTAVHVGAHRRHHHGKIEQHFHIHSPAGTVPDAKHSASRIAAELRRRGAAVLPGY